MHSSARSSLELLIWQLQKADGLIRVWRSVRRREQPMVESFEGSRVERVDAMRVDTKEWQLHHIWKCLQMHHTANPRVVAYTEVSTIASYTKMLSNLTYETEMPAVI